MAPDSPKRSASVRRCYHQTERFRTCLTNPAPLRDNPYRSVRRTPSVCTPQQEEGAGRADTNPINALRKGESMNDAENLSKLLGHLPPEVFREFMVNEFHLAMPDLD